MRFLLRHPPSRRRRRALRKLLLAAAQKVQARGVPAPPENQPREVTVRFYPH